jgi:hypothetical protein
MNINININITTSNVETTDIQPADPDTIYH